MKNTHKSNRPSLIAQVLAQYVISSENNGEIIYQIDIKTKGK